MSFIRRILPPKRVRADIRRALNRINTNAMLFSGWTWIAAGSLVGFEVLDLVFGALALTPELLPIVLLALALAWLFRERLRRASRHLRAYRRLRRRR